MYTLAILYRLSGRDEEIAWSYLLRPVPTTKCYLECTRCVGTVTVRQQVLSAEGKNGTTHSSKTPRLWNLKKTASHEWYRKVAFCAGRKFSSEITSAKPHVNFPSNPWSQTPKETCLFRVLACTCFPLGLVHLEYQYALQALQGPGKLITTTTTTTPKCHVLEVAQSNHVVIRRQIHYFFTTWIVTTSR